MWMAGTTLWGGERFAFGILGSVKMTMESRKTSRWKKRQSPVRGRGASTGVVDDGRAAYPPHPGRRMSIEEFLGWVHEKTRAEWVDGEVIIMSPVNYVHDQLQGWLIRLVGNFVENHEAGQVCGSEFYMALPDPDARRLPDVAFVSNENPGKFKHASFAGSPDLVIEVVSPDSVERDYEEKLATYQSSGVKEYWIVDPLEEQVTVYEWVKGKYRAIAEKNGIVRSKVLPGFFVKPAWLWQRPLSKVAMAMREMGVK